LEGEAEVGVILGPKRGGCALKKEEGENRGGAFYLELELSMGIQRERSPLAEKADLYLFSLPERRPVTITPRLSFSLSSPAFSHLSLPLSHTLAWP
jgi:hypothetical protein